MSHPDDRNQRRIEDLERRQRQHPQDLEAFLALARGYMTAGRHLQAAEMLEGRIRAASPPEWTLVELFCEASRQSGRAAEAHELLGLLGAAFEDRAPYWTLRGRMLEETGRLDEARDEHRQAVSRAPEDAEAAFRLAVTQMKLHADEEALAGFERCLVLDPTMTKAQINLGVIYDQMGKSELAITAFRRAIEANPRSVESHCNLGAAYGDLGRKKDAVEEFRRALEIDPDCALARFNLGVALMESAPEEALNELRRAQALDPGNWEISFNLGLVYVRKGAYDASVKLLQACVQARPNAAAALYYLGVAYNKKDQPGLAIECLERVVDLEPTNGRAHFYLGVAYDKKGQSERALLCYQAADRLGGRE